jgi:hypothetical protein
LLIPSSCPGEVNDEDTGPGVKSKATMRFIESTAKLSSAQDRVRE